VLIVVRLTGQPPAGYYNEAMGLSGTELQQALHNIIKTHTAQSYSSLFLHFQSTDRKADLTIWDIYSDVPGGTPPYVYFYNAGMECGNYTGEGQCYNREHSWPRSWFGGSIMPMHSDLFHLYPTDGFVNNRRGNFPFGEVANPTWTSMNGSMVGANISPGYSGVVFEPIDAYKGDLARTYFYMSVRYYGQDSGWPGSPMTTGSQLNPRALDLLRAWHVQDPVSDKELARNNAVYVIQANRNPFIDYPAFVNAIWGAASAIDDPSDNLKISIYPIPVGEQCVISFPNTKEGVIHLTVFDLSGRIHSLPYHRNNEGILLITEQLLAGIYFVRIYLDHDFLGIAKFVK